MEVFDAIRRFPISRENKLCAGKRMKYSSIRELAQFVNVFVVLRANPRSDIHNLCGVGVGGGAAAMGRDGACRCSDHDRQNWSRGFYNGYRSRRDRRVFVAGKATEFAQNREK
jgi:hypothetical protein